jgi:hypothetical protein
MNPVDLARKIETVIADYDTGTALTALEITKLLVHHRESARLAFEAAQIASGDSGRSVSSQWEDSGAQS